MACNCMFCFPITVYKKMPNSTTYIEYLMGASKNSEFAQMQGAEKISPRRICFICKQEIFYATQQLG
jgi:hypothetical protein